MIFVINGIRYHVDNWVTGGSLGPADPLKTPLLLLHGFTGSGGSWKELDHYWKGDFNIFAVDIIGHGKTDSPEDVAKYNIEAVADDLYALLLKLKIDQIDVLGYSMGGRLALTFALKYPKKVRKLILESSSPGLVTTSERESRRLQDEKLACRIQNEGIEKFVDYWEDIPLFHSQKRLPESTRQRIRNERLRNCAKGLINSLRGMGTGAQPSWWNELQKLSNPVLFITGSIDTKFCLIAEKMQSKLKNGTWIEIEDCGHAIHVEKPEMFGTIVSEFLLYEKDDTCHSF
ncbi:2-succinyl-6-hydroxy-2,4-cyclohexadiene-1-carboxylate synthase [Cytobacillus depressus]|uniref:Putative 2-succinyl-6-hydroxy-2,4-cyclohexadiene-1-carboxylate synthase n=1 Tax=Cytobacillus depressus TaxID=1602942 RepID=A0A6L3VB78_9BACI|nr:2-succinyl-6-hydroxy-2,4-cyclohexadiene-1-carboxylate synthase [Cytobacillus depressus]KAB2338921.1 2-succinyl-6-hydroxy-2,4-cyclohexadiene-1-carboxylate synthase [Cytobacillus depressus]